MCKSHDVCVIFFFFFESINVSNVFGRFFSFHMNIIFFFRFVFIFHFRIFFSFFFLKVVTDHVQIMSFIHIIILILHWMLTHEDKFMALVPFMIIMIIGQIFAICKKKKKKNEFHMFMCSVYCSGMLLSSLSWSVDDRQNQT